MKLTSKYICLLFLFSGLLVLAQSVKETAHQFPQGDEKNYEKINDSIPHLIPRKVEGKFGYINQKGDLLIPAVYSNVGFFTEDCTLLNSSDPKVQKFGSAQYASVRYMGVDYRIDYKGKRVYRYKDEELGKCPFEYKEQLYHSYVRQGYYGVIEKKNFFNELDYRQYLIYPQFQYLHILEGDDLKNPMIVAAHDNRFGVINIQGEIVIPFVYADIKRNFSWKLARLFEVSEDGKNYYFIDRYGNRF